MTRRTTTRQPPARPSAILHGTSGRAATVAGRTLAVALAGCCLTACAHTGAGGAAPAPAPPATSSGAPTFASPSLPPPPPPPSLPDPVQSSPGFAENTAVNCAGRPTAAQVTDRVRAAGLITGGARTSVSFGPVCAGDWQYTILAVSGREPLQVVTRGLPAALTVVTAGTNVCSTEVVGAAPTGIINAAQCGLGAPPP